MPQQGQELVGDGTGTHKLNKSQLPSPFDVKTLWDSGSPLVAASKIRFDELRFGTDIPMPFLLESCAGFPPGLLGLFALVIGCGTEVSVPAEC